MVTWNESSQVRQEVQDCCDNQDSGSAECSRYLFDTEGQAWTMFQRGRASVAFAWHHSPLVASESAW